MKKQTLPHDPRAHSRTLGCKDNTVRTANNKGVKEYAEKYKEINFADYNGILPLIEKFSNFISTDDLHPNMMFVYYCYEQNYLAATNGHLLVISHFEKRVFDKDRFFNILALPCDSEGFKHPECPSIIQNYFQSTNEKVEYTLDFSQIVYMTEKELLNEEEEQEFKLVKNKKGEFVPKLIVPKKTHAFVPNFLPNHSFDVGYIKRFRDNFSQICKASYELDGKKWLVFDYGDDEWGGRIFGVISPKTL